MFLLINLSKILETVRWGQVYRMLNVLSTRVEFFLNYGENSRGTYVFVKKMAWTYQKR